MNPFVETSRIVAVIESWLAPRLDPPAHDWLRDRLSAVAGGDKKGLYLAFGLAPRKTGKGDLSLVDQELAAAEAARSGWNPRQWTVDQAARMLLVLSFPASDAASFVGVLDQLFASGEVQELIALYQGLPLYPHPAAFQLRCAEGLRTNIKTVFTAIAHGNPFPSERLDEDQWNQMVLKSVFIGAELNPIAGLDRRANAKLARILVEFAQERWAAHRPVTPELWRCVGPFAAEIDGLTALERTLATGNELERQAAILALRSSSSPGAAELLSRFAGIVNATPAATWNQIAGGARSPSS